MKNKIFLFTYFFAFILTASKKNPELIPAYSIIKISADPTLKEQDAGLAFKFYAGSTANPIKEAVKFSYNKTGRTSARNAEGKFSLVIKAGKYIFQFYYN